MREAGFSEAAIAAARAEAAPTVIAGDFDVHPDNRQAVQLFLALQSQWRVTSRSTWSRAETIRTGLDYAAIEPTARMDGIELATDDFRRIRVMEAVALTAWAEQARAQR